MLPAPQCTTLTISPRRVKPAAATAGSQKGGLERLIKLEKPQGSSALQAATRGKAPTTARFDVSLPCQLRLMRCPCEHMHRVQAPSGRCREITSTAPKFKLLFHSESAASPSTCQHAGGEQTGHICMEKAMGWSWKSGPLGGAG